MQTSRLQTLVLWFEPPTRHEDPSWVHTRKRASVLRTAHPPPSGVRTQANSQHEGRLGTGGTARVQVLCVEEVRMTGQAPQVKEQCGVVAFSVRVYDHHLHMSRHSLSEELVA